MRARLGVRARLAASASVAVSALSRRLHVGGGSVIGGRVGLLIDPGLVGTLAQGRPVALVSATNGKTTTTRLLAAALGGPARVATSAAGANLPPGLAVALATARPGAPAVLEVDEAYLGSVAHAVDPDVVVLMNLSRDQLDRVSEVRMVAAKWRQALAGLPGTTVVANADDPLVVWGARSAAQIVWVAAGALWRQDAGGCPECGGGIEQDAATGEWWCSCGLRRPTPTVSLVGDELVTADGRRLPLDLSLPGRFNRANAAMAAAAAQVMGVDMGDALVAMGAVTDVEGRFASIEHRGVRARLLLAKNPAGWIELLDMVQDGALPVVVGINARIADGLDPSWLWDVPFERLGGRLVVATGERCRDLAVRLRHAGVAHLTEPDQERALASAGSPAVDYIGNYTAFQALRRRVAGRGWRHHGRARGEHGAPDARRDAPSAAAVPDVSPGAVPTRPVPAAVVARGDEGAAGGRPRARPTAGTASALRIVVVHPDLLGTYGDTGNGQVLAGRALWRGLDVELVHAHSDGPLPASGDVYCLGGGEDRPQVRSAELLRHGALARAVEDGAVVLAVCAGFQVIGESFPDTDGSLHPGVGLLEVTTVKGPGRRIVGELATAPLESAGGAPTPGGPSTWAADVLTGFENHSAVTTLGPSVRALGRVLVGTGNGASDVAGAVDGARHGRVVGTYLHGPVLARNPRLADQLLGLATGGELPPLDDAEEDALRAERLRAVHVRVLAR
ncbi:MAG TPA: MurT ligase domain-containing protein [Acidimicrobiales bacterium]|nr:MurT ligase domain-containing protein [Acidimicrobiales bacterium]